MSIPDEINAFIDQDPGATSNIVWNAEGAGLELGARVALWMTTATAGANGIVGLGLSLAQAGAAIVTIKANAATLAATSKSRCFRPILSAPLGSKPNQRLELARAS